MKRTCSLCGASYEPTDTITRCTELQGGSYCGGEVLPVPQEEKPTANCLVCMDTGWVLMDRQPPIRCHRGCPTQEEKA